MRNPRYYPSPTLQANRRHSNLAYLLSNASSPAHAAELHCHLITSNSLSHSHLHSSLVSLYARCDLLSSATSALLSLPSSAQHHSVSPAACTAVLSRLSRSQHPSDAISLFSLLRLRCLLPHPNPFTFSALLPACHSSSSVSQFHSLALKYGAANNHHLFTSSALTHMYAKSSHMDSAEQVFDEMPCRSIVSWNALILGYSHNHLFHKAIFAFRQLLLHSSMKPDQVTFSGVLSACANAGQLSFGSGAHSMIIKTMLDSLAYINNSLISMYSKCGRLDDARKLFDKWRDRDAVGWNVMISGLVETERFEEACGLFVRMRRFGIEPDEASFSTLLHASSNLAELLLGAEIHCQVVKFGLAKNRCISSSLITMYSKCGSVEEAQLTFTDTKDQRNVVSWTAMIAAYQQHGLGDRVLQLFEEMVEAGVEPDYITFVCVLSACSHAGLIEKGFKYFNSMSGQDHKKKMMPGNEHYACVVDMLGRAGRLDDAKQFIDEMPVKPGASVWGALLGACGNRRNLELGKEVAYKLFEIEPRNPGNYVLLSNLYAAHGKMKEANEVRRLMRNNGVKKETSCSWIDVRNKTYVFTVHDQSHERTQEIYEMLSRMEDLVKEKGYVADTLCAVNDVEEYKEHGLWHHSERLALAFGLISLPKGAPIRIKKNLRTCGDCHTVMKHVSWIFQRLIILRDINRFHKFVGGSCSCKDYW